MSHCLQPAFSSWGNRRAFLQSSATGVATSSLLVVAGGEYGQQLPLLQQQPILPAFAAAENEKVKTSPLLFILLQVYQVIPDASEALNPSLKVVDTQLFLQRILDNVAAGDGGGGALWLGEHHNSKRDHAVQAKLLRDLYELRRARARARARDGNQRQNQKWAVGLEQVQVQYQPVLDQFVAGQVSLEELPFLVQWDQRWVWPFQVYREIFVTARELGMDLVALNVNSEDLAVVEQGGLPALPRQTLQSYIADPDGFAQFSTGSQFRTYVDYVIRTSYDLHLKLGLLNRNTMSFGAVEQDDAEQPSTQQQQQQQQQPMPFRNFFSGRILWDETMAHRAYTWTRNNPGGILVGLVGADHVKFGNGIPARYARMMASSMSTAAAVPPGDGGTSSPSRAASISVLLNPTLTDSRPSGAVLGTPRTTSVSNNTMTTTTTTTSPQDAITLQVRYLKEGIDRDSDERLLPSSTGGVMPLADYLVFGP